MSLYPQDELYKEMSFIAYYYHWDEPIILNLEHSQRRRWCEEISRINKELSPSKKEKNIFELKK